MSEFLIHELPLAGGVLAISPVPGRGGEYAEDKARVLAWKPSLVITMTEQAELGQVGAGDLAADLAVAGIHWRHLPITDLGAPGPDVDAAWPGVSELARGFLDQGGRVLVHCFGGCGRSGMVCVRLMIEAGEAPPAALKRLRAVRPCVIETDAQMAWALGRD